MTFGAAPKATAAAPAAPATKRPREMELFIGSYSLRRRARTGGGCDLGQMREKSLRAAVTVAVLGSLAGCVSHAPRLQIPARVHADCENRAVKQTAIDSIVASTDDQVRPAAYPGDAALMRRIR